jgi:uncharacterized membrane protein
MYNDRMEKQQLVPEKDIHQLFEISVFLKGIHAIIEIIGGLALYFVSTDVISSALEWVAESDYLDDPHDIISNFLMHQSSSLSVHSKTFAAFYLFSHGIIKIFLVVGLLRNKVWAYPTSLVVLGLFIVYQVYRYNITHSVWLIVLTVFDILVMWLIWHEYKLVRAGKPLT